MLQLVSTASGQPHTQIPTQFVPPLPWTEPSLTTTGWSLKSNWEHGDRQETAGPISQLGLPTETGAFVDSHKPYNFNPPFSSDVSWTIEQKYQWTAPWKKDAQGNDIWTDLLSDTLIRSIKKENGKWYYIIDSTQAGQLKQEVFYMTVTQQANKAFLEWEGAGILQVIEKFGDDWQDVLGATSPYELKNPLPSASQLFYRLKR